MFGVVNQSLVALRSEPFERSEMVSQVLFGETFSLIEEHKGWLRVELTLDSYVGWLDTKSCQLFDQDQMNLLTLKDVLSVATRLFSAKHYNSEFPIRLCPGSNLYNFNSDSGTFMLIGQEYKTFNVPFDVDNTDQSSKIISLAQSFLNAPYLWGGRTPYGIDCSGLSQLVYKMCGIPIPRDASQQVLIGNTVEFLNLSKTGDLAFFDDEEGNITHVGIILPESRIIHSSGFVKIDKLDHQGIFSTQTKSYSHKLRVVKRLMND
jgi:hypothetical protein